MRGKPKLLNPDDKDRLGERRGPLIGTSPSGPPDPKAIAFVCFAIALEAAMLITMYGVYAETMGGVSGHFLCELPLLGRIFCLIDEDMSVSHLLALLLAVFSIGVPIAIWSYVIENKIHLDPQAWIAQPTNKVYAFLAGALYGLVLLLEVVNLYTLIAQASVGGFGMASGTASALTQFLAENQGLGVFVAVLFAVVNTVVALMTVIAMNTINDMRKG